MYMGCVSNDYGFEQDVGISSTEGFAADIFANAVVGVIATPFMAVPLLSAAIAYGYVGAVGESYLDSLMCVVERSTVGELKNNELMAKR